MRRFFKKGLSILAISGLVLAGCGVAQGRCKEPW